jgi:hypothetical protein
MSTANTNPNQDTNEKPAAADLPAPPKRPISEARLRANRENAKRSTGPRTEEGKQRSRQNAAQHHFTAQVIPLPDEERALLDDCIRQFTAEYKPVGYQELNLVHMLAHTQYRLHRLAYAEHHLFALGPIAPAPGEPSGIDQSPSSDAEGLAEMLRRARDPISTLSIYEQRLMRHYQRTLRTLLEIQAERKAEERQNEADLYVIARCHANAKVPFHASDFGFVCSDDEIKDLIKRRVTLDRALYARDQGFDPESCKRATHFSR